MSDRPLFVAYATRRNIVGWAVIDAVSEITNGAHIRALAESVERKFGYDPGTVVITFWRRLEDHF